MNQSERDKIEFSVAMGELAEKCQISGIDNPKIKAYWQELHTYGIERFKAACHELATQEGRVFFPTVGEFVQVLNGSLNDRALEAWTTVLRSVGAIQPTTGKQFHAGHPPTFTDPNIAGALQGIGGYSSVCNVDQTTQAIDFMRRNFIDYYGMTERKSVRDKIEVIGKGDASAVLVNLNRKALK